MMKRQIIGVDAPTSRDREIGSMERRQHASSIATELGLLGLLLVSGVTGLVMESATATITMFVGGFLTWLVFTFPQFIKASRKQWATEAAATEAATAEAKTAVAAVVTAVLPTPTAVMALIRKRRSVYPRDYNGAKVPREQLEQLLEAANWAPTHGQTEPWRFVVLEGSSKQAMEELTLELCRTRLPADKAAKTIEKMEKKRDSTWGKVSCYIAICCKRQAKPDKVMPEWEEMAAVACAVQNMHLLATSLGLAAYWTTWQEVAREAAEMKALLGLLPEDRVMGFFTLGRADRERLEGYRGSRGPWADKVTWRD